MASLQLRLDCAGVSLQSLCWLDRITVQSNSSRRVELPYLAITLGTRFRYVSTWLSLVLHAAQRCDIGQFGIKI